MSEERFDLVILGSGSTAFAAALKAAELGKTAVMTDSRTVGGTCVNRGCLPSKNLVEAARIYWEAQHPRFPGLVGKKLDLDFKALVAGKDEIIHDYRGRKYESMLAESERVKLYQGQATLVDSHTVALDGRSLRGDQILIATGSRPLIPTISGLPDVPYLTSDLLTTDEEVELFEQPRSLIVVGGGYIGLELGQMFHRFGTKVTILQRSDRILPNYEPEVSIAVSEALREEGIDIRTDIDIKGVRAEDGGVTAVVRRGGHEGTAHAERILVATSRTPNTDLIGLDRADVAPMSTASSK